MAIRKSPREVNRGYAPVRRGHDWPSLLKFSKGGHLLVRETNMSIVIVYLYLIWLIVFKCNIIVCTIDKYRQTITRNKHNKHVTTGCTLSCKPNSLSIISSPSQNQTKHNNNNNIYIYIFNHIHISRKMKNMLFIFGRLKANWINDTIDILNR